MRQLLLIVLFIAISVTNSYSQPKADEPTTQSQKIYFPASLYEDPKALDKAIPGVAEKVISSLSDKEKKEHGKVIDYYMLAGNYQKAIEEIDSVQTKKKDTNESMELKIYANAKIKEKAGSGSFNKIFKQDFEDEFNKLSFAKKVMVAFDTPTLNQLNKDYKKFFDKLKKNKEDSINSDDAKELCHKYIAYTYSNEIYSIVSSTVSAPQYQIMYPAIKKAGPNSGVAPVQDVDEKPDPNIRYKLLMELTSFDDKDEALGEINGPLAEVSRKINLHVAAGIPKNKIDLVLVVHAGALYAFMNNEKYKRKFGVDNPNITLIKELQDFGAKIIVCGQAMTWFKLEKEEMLPGIKQALTAQTVLSTYELKGYKFYNVGW